MSAIELSPTVYNLLAALAEHEGQAPEVLLETMLLERADEARRVEVARRTQLPPGIESTDFDRERARTWLVQAFGYLDRRLELQVDSLAREFARARQR